MTRLFIQLLLISLFRMPINAQSKIDTSYFLTLQNKKSLTCKLNGELLGCKQRLECRSASVVFYSITFDRQNNRLVLSGRVLDASLRDSVGAVGLNIFIAQPVNNKLIRLREVSAAEIGGGNSPINLKVPKRSGDFKVDFHFSKQDKLYFEGELYDPVEFDIGQLLDKYVPK